MFKQLSICAALIAFATGCANAQQREAILQTIDVPAAAFDLVLATPKLPTTIFDFSESPDALIVHLVGGELALGFESAEEMLNAAETLRSPIGAFHIRRDGSNARVPVAVYMVPKGQTLTAVRR